MGYRVQYRRDTAARWAEINPILLDGEIGYVKDNPNQYKMGDGIHAWNDLPLRGFDGTIAPTLGYNDDAVLSQRIVTEKFDEQDEKLSELGSLLSGIREVERVEHYFATKEWKVLPLRINANTDYILYVQASKPVESDVDVTVYELSVGDIKTIGTLIKGTNSIFIRVKESSKINHIRIKNNATDDVTISVSLGLGESQQQQINNLSDTLESTTNEIKWDINKMREVEGAEIYFESRDWKSVPFHAEAQKNYIFSVKTSKPVESDVDVTVWEGGADVDVIGTLRKGTTALSMLITTQYAINRLRIKNSTTDDVTFFLSLGVEESQQMQLDTHKAQIKALNDGVYNLISFAENTVKGLFAANDGVTFYSVGNGAVFKINGGDNISIIPNEDYQCLFTFYSELTLDDSGGVAVVLSEGENGRRSTKQPISVVAPDDAEYVVFNTSYINDADYTPFAIRINGNYYCITNDVVRFVFDSKSLSANTITDFSQKVLSQFESKNNLAVIPINKRVSNAENTQVWGSVFSEDALETIIEGESENKNVGCKVKSNYYARPLWLDYEPTLGSYDFSAIDGIVGTCRDFNVRMVLRLQMFSTEKYDTGYVTKPNDYNENVSKYSEYLERYSATFNNEGRLVVAKFPQIDGDKYVDNFVVKIGFPNDLFWAMIIEGSNPILASYLSSNQVCVIPDYSSTVFRNAWKNVNTALYNYLNSTYKDGVLYKHYIEDMQCGVGAWSEGSFGNNIANVKNDRYFSVPSEATHKEYYDFYVSLYNDIPVSVPTAITYGGNYSNSCYSYIWGLSNSIGLVGVFSDVMEYNNDYSAEGRPFEAILRESANGRPRRFSGEISPAPYRSFNLDNLIKFAYDAKVSGGHISQERNPLANGMMQKFITLQGAKIAIVNAIVAEGILEMDIQNIGYCNVFSPYWECYLIERNIDGQLIKKTKIDIDVRAINPNYTDYGNVGMLNPHSEHKLFSVQHDSIDNNFFFAIIDKYGVYDNYWLNNIGRSKEGEYRIK